MTDTRYSAEALRAVAAEMHDLSCRHNYTCLDRAEASKCAAMLRIAARDAETLAGIRAWLVKSQSEPCACLECASYRTAIAELDRLSRGDA